MLNTVKLDFNCFIYTVWLPFVNMHGYLLKCIITCPIYGIVQVRLYAAGERTNEKTISGEPWLFEESS